MVRGRLARLALIPLLLAAGCAVTREIETMEELRKVRPQPLLLLAADRTQYELMAYTVLDSALEGMGFHIVDGVRSPFEGRIAYGDLLYIQRRSPSLGYGIVATVAGGAAVLFLIDAAEKERLYLYKPEPSSGGSSCPYVYAWDGTGYRLQGEAFGTAFGRGLEATTACLLPAAFPREGEIALRLANGRPETHYVDAVRLLAYAAPAEAEVVLDAENRAWPVRAARPPLRSSRAQVGPSAERGYRDSIEVAFARPPGAESASLVVRAINTSLVYEAFTLVFGYLGDQTLPFLDQIEHDPELLAALRDWIRDCSLTVEVAGGGGWTIAGRVAPEASAIAFERLVRLRPAGDRADSVRVRLSSLADLWRIEAVEIDWTPAQPLAGHPLPLRRAEMCADGEAGVGGRAGALLAGDGERYAVMFPGDRIDLTFAAGEQGEEAIPRSRDERIVYALEVRGYLHEWPPAEAPAALASLPMAPGPQRLAYVRAFVRDPQALLPLVYGSRSP